MNHRMLTPAEKLAHKSRRNWRKSQRKKARTYNVFFANLRDAQILPDILVRLDRERVHGLYDVGSRPRQRALEYIEAQSAFYLLHPAETWGIPIQAPFPQVAPPVVTHQFVLCGGTWRHRKIKPFELW